MSSQKLYLVLLLSCLCIAKNLNAQIVPPQQPLIPGQQPPVPGQQPLVPGQQPLVPGQQPVPGQCRQMHVIKQGDALNTIARMYQVSLDSLFSANPEVNALDLQVGSQLCIP